MTDRNYVLFKDVNMQVEEEAGDFSCRSARILPSLLETWHLATSKTLRANPEQFELNTETPLHRAGNGKGPTSTWPFMGRYTRS